MLLLWLLVALTKSRLKLCKMWLRLLGLLLGLWLRLLICLLLVCGNLWRLLLLLLLLQLTTVVLGKVFGETHGRRSVVHFKCLIRCNVSYWFSKSHGTQEAVKHLLLLVKQGLRLVLSLLLLLLLLLQLRLLSRSLVYFWHFVRRISTVIHTNFLSRTF